MDIKWLLFSSDGNLSRKDFWKSILCLYSIPYFLTILGDAFFVKIGEDKISFMVVSIQAQSGQTIKISQKAQELVFSILD